MTKAWKDNKDEIIKLYINEGRTLQDVMTIMSQKRGFMASTRSYRQHFDLWHVGKYNCKRRQKRRQSFMQPNLPSPPRTPPMPQLNPSEERSFPGSASEVMPGTVTRADLHYPFLKQDPVQAFSVQSQPYRHASHQQLIKAETPGPQAPQSREQPSLNMNCWDADERQPTGWIQGAYFASKKDHMARIGDVSRYSPEEASFSVSSGPASPTWADQQSPMSDDLDWSVSKQRPSSHYVGMSPALSQHQGQLHKPDHKPLQPPAFHSSQSSFVHTTTQPPARRQSSVVDHASAALELQNKRPCIDRTAVHQTANFQLELA